MAILCIDDEEVQKLRRLNKRIITYGFNGQADVRADNVRSDNKGTTFDVFIKDEVIKDIFIPINGQHNIQNLPQSPWQWKLELKTKIKTVRKI